jgi:hypothetical protein
LRHDAARTDVDREHETARDDHRDRKHARQQILATATCRALCGGEALGDRRADRHDEPCAQREHCTSRQRCEVDDETTDPQHGPHQTQRLVLSGVEHEPDVRHHADRHQAAEVIGVEQRAHDRRRGLRWLVNPVQGPGADHLVKQREQSGETGRAGHERHEYVATTLGGGDAQRGDDEAGQGQEECEATQARGRIHARGRRRNDLERRPRGSDTEQHHERGPALEASP